MTSSWKLTLNNAEDQQESWLKKLLSLLYKLLGYSLPLWKYSVRNLRGSVWGIFLLLLVASFSFLEFSILWFFICLFKFVVLTREWISYIYRLQFTLFSFATIEYLLFFLLSCCLILQSHMTAWQQDTAEQGRRWRATCKMWEKQHLFKPVYFLMEQEQCTEHRGEKQTKVSIPSHVSINWYWCYQYLDQFTHSSRLWSPYTHS